MRLTSCSFIAVSFLLVTMVAVPVRGSQTDVVAFRPPVQVKTPGSNWQSVTSRHVIWPDQARIKVGDGGLIELETDHSDRIKVNEETTVSTDFRNMDRIELDLGVGDLNIDVNKRKRPGRDFDVQIGEATLGVRGTKYTVSYRNDILDVRVTEGRVGLNRSGELLGVLKPGDSRQVDLSSSPQAQSRQGKKQGNKTGKTAKQNGAQNSKQWSEYEKRKQSWFRRHGEPGVRPEAVGSRSGSAKRPGRSEGKGNKRARSKSNEQAGGSSTNGAGGGSSNASNGGSSGPKASPGNSGNTGGGPPSNAGGPSNNRGGGPSNNPGKGSGPK